jgi:MFS family permease
MFSLGLYCMLGGGVGVLLATGFQDVASTFDVPLESIALTTGVYMLGLGLGGVLFSPTAIVFGKRPVYIFTGVVFLGTCIWCAKASSYNSLLAGRFIQGIAVSPVEVLPSATISEIFFLHERAFSLGIYVLLLLSGKNLIPLVGAVIIGNKGWQWVFWILGISVTIALISMFFFLPETFWDRRTPTQAPSSKNSNSTNSMSANPETFVALSQTHSRNSSKRSAELIKVEPKETTMSAIGDLNSTDACNSIMVLDNSIIEVKDSNKRRNEIPSVSRNDGVSTHGLDIERSPAALSNINHLPLAYTDHWRSVPRKTYVQSLNIFPGRLSYDSWFVIAIRPFGLFIYPAVLWSAMVYSLSIGWLIVLSESVSEVYRSRETYSFTAFQAGLVYISPFVGAVLGTAVTGKLSDTVVKFMAKRNRGVYEPEFRLLMAPLIAITTAIGLMGFGWSVEQKDSWVVPTVFFGIISFGCSLGSSTAITFCVDSYKQFAGEALVTLNFSKSESNCDGSIQDLERTVC